MTKQNQRIHLSIGFGDTILPIINCDDGHQRVPLKPISDQIGLDWKTQKRKLLGNDYFVERFGLILGEARIPQNEDLGETSLPHTSEIRQVFIPQLEEIGLKRDQYLIRVDRVTAFLNSLNPHNIGAKGNEDSAAWLMAKHQEWDDALHAYETHGVAVKPGKCADEVIRALSRIDRIGNPSLKQIAAEKANAEYGLNIEIGKQQGLEL